MINSHSACSLLFGVYITVSCSTSTNHCREKLSLQKTCDKFKIQEKE